RPSWRRSLDRFLIRSNWALNFFISFFPGGDPRSHKWKRGLLLPGAPQPRLPLLRRQDFKIGLSNRITRPEQPEHSCRWQLCEWPDNGGTMPSKSTPFTPSSILFRPRRSPALGLGLGGGAGYCPRVRKVYYDG